MANPTQPFDVYGNTQALDKPVLDAVAARLEARGKHPAFQRMLHAYLDTMQIDSAPLVLDLGCGTGFAARQIAARPKFAGRVIGIDISTELIRRAIQLANDEGVSDRVDFRAGDVGGLGLSDGAFDAVVAHTLLSHVEEPLVVLREMKRVTKSGGFVGIFDGDYASLTFGHPDPEQGKAIDAMIVSSIVTQTRVMRQMPLLLNVAGLVLQDARAHVVSDIGRADFWAPSVESMRRLLPAAKTMTAAEANSWADVRMQESAEGVFFASSNYYSYVARKP